MTVKLRLEGEPEEIAALLARMAEVVEVGGRGRTFPKRDGFGVMTYVEVRLPDAQTATAERLDPQPGLPAARNAAPPRRAASR
jgi:hypothetical protein